MRTALAALCLALLLGAAPAAHAETWDGSDPAGDVTAYFHTTTPKPCGTTAELAQNADRDHDIVGLHVDHGPDSVVIGLTLRSLPSNRSYYADLHLRVPGHDYRLDDFPVPADQADTVPQVDLSDAPPAPHHLGPCGTYGYIAADSPCEGLAVTRIPATTTLQYTVPRSCVGDPRWVEVGAFIGTPSRHVAGDHWGDPSDAPNRFVGPLSPRVRVG